MTYEISKRDLEHISKLVPEMQEKARLFLVKANTFLPIIHPDLCVAFQWNQSVLKITDSLRDPLLQAGLYSQGRRWDKNSRLWVEDKTNGQIVTWTVSSKHTQGKAFDAAPFLGKTPHWPSPEVKENKIVYEHLHKIAHAIGLKTLGMKDVPHYEI